MMAVVGFGFRLGWLSERTHAGRHANASSRDADDASRKAHAAIIGLLLFD
jgi:hypothetical protein